MGVTQKKLRQRYPNAGKLSFVLTKDAPPWGKEGDVLRVARGFALNYLVPRNLAVPASPEVVAEAEAKRAAEEAARVAEFEAKAKLAGQLRAVGKFSLTRTVGEDGKLFGSVTSADVIGVMSAKVGADLDGMPLTFLKKTMDHLGDYPIAIKVHPDITVDLILSLVAK
ncbi:hypothetical protein CTAYLR_006532 [Chrysophaeum taylorii]|uniref:50S ribosomal protein L9, chloroplastic n=1 Tax=Chrysophaeum taylorii TaxID=2483200 RepID=A0AAD7XJJ3_9STRA|nr:hypothetical protein CTAYLR_006532 [Chrysophaeum taylorii]